MSFSYTMVGVRLCVAPGLKSSCTFSTTPSGVFLLFDFVSHYDSVQNQLLTVRFRSETRRDLSIEPTAENGRPHIYLKSQSNLMSGSVSCASPPFWLMSIDNMMITT